MEIGSGREECRLSTPAMYAVKVAGGKVAGGVVVMDEGSHPTSATTTPMPNQNIRRMLAKLFPIIGSPPH